MSSFLLLLLHGALGSLGLALMELHLVPARSSVLSGALLDNSVMLAAVGIGLYVASFLLWLTIVTKLPLTYAYPMSVGITLLATSLLSIFFLAESLSLFRIIGMATILLGVVIVNLAS